MSGYGQFCPVAKAAEVLDQRWMLLVVREMVAGSTHFNDIHRGVPRMSRTLLSKRLKQLIAEGLARRVERDGGPVYELTAAGEELLPVIEALGRWGVRWMSSLADDDIDPAFLLWDVRRGIDTDVVPEGQTVVALVFTDIDHPGVRDWWLVLRRDDVAVCDHDPGFGTDVAIEIPIRTFVEVWRGDLGWDDAVRTQSVELRGPTHLRRQVSDWFEQSHFAGVPRAT